MIHPMPVLKEVQAGKIGSHIWNAIGNTPLLRLETISKGIKNDVQIFTKAEWQNPGGSVKDRAVKNIILDAEQSGQLTRDKIILEASSGNTALAYAMIASAKGYQTILCLSSNINPDLIRRIRSNGATVILTNPVNGTDGAIEEANRIYSLNPDRYFYNSQYDNPANWLAHYNSTGHEIWNQTNGEITHFVAGMGTSGTFMGTGRRLQTYNPDIRFIGVQPDSAAHGLEGLKHYQSSIRPKIYDPDFADGMIVVSTGEAKQAVKRLAREEGIFAGISSGAALAACLKLANEIGFGRIVTIFPDGGARYINEVFTE